ncbi:MAG: hypothetical protein R6X02_33130 [Enhygromyxa sp.]
MTDQLQPSNDKPPQSLLEHPQRLGILPTQWFWKQQNPPAIRWGFALLAGLTVGVTLLLTDSVLVAGLVPPLVLVLANGLLEKYIRRQVLKRRRALERADALDGRRQLVAEATNERS